MSLTELLESNVSHFAREKAEDVAFAYVRVSHKDSADNNLSPEVQKRLIEDYAARKNIVIKRLYTDLAKSAYRDNDLRAEYQEMLCDAKSDPEVTVVLVAYYDRFSRSSGVSVEQADLLKNGVRIESVSEGYFDPNTESGVIMNSITWAMANVQSLKIRNRVIPCMKMNFAERDAESGYTYKNGGWALFGYKVYKIPVGKNRKHEKVHKSIWQLDDREFGGRQVWEWARTMLLDWRLKEGLGYDAIAGRLTKAEVPTPSGRDLWSSSTIQEVLTEWSRLYQYAGYAFWNRRDFTDRNDIRTRDTSEWVVVENAHPAIITAEECDALLAIVKNKKQVKKTHKGQPSRWTLSGGAIRCRQCGQNYTSTNKHGVDSYACGSYVYRHKAGCSATMWKIGREELEQVLFEKLIGRLDSYENALPSLVAGINAAVEREWEGLLRTVDERRDKIKALEAQLGGYYDIASQLGLSEELKAQIKVTQTAIDELKAFENLNKPAFVDISEVRSIASTIRDAGNPEDVTARGRIVKQFVTEMVADGNEKIITGKLLDPLTIGSNKLVAPGGVEPPPRP